MQNPQAEPANSAVTYAACPNCSKLNKINLSRAKSAKPTCGACRAEIDFHSGILNASTDQLQATIEKSPLPVLVDFWAPWCGPCRAFAPTFERVAQEKAGKAVFIKINTEAHMAASQIYGVRGIPTLTAFNDGKEVDRLGGALPYDNFSAWASQYAR